MPDDPNRKHIDDWFVSSQPYEYEYFKIMTRQNHPNKSEIEIADAILACRKCIAPSEGRSRLTECLNKRLRGW